MLSENKDVVRRYCDEIMNGRKLELLGNFWAEEKMLEPVRRGCFSYFTAFPDMHVAIDELIEEGDRVFCRSTMTGTQDGEYKGIPPTGRAVSADSAEVYQITGGKITGYWCLTNVAGIMRQLTEERTAAKIAAG